MLMSYGSFGAVTPVPGRTDLIQYVLPGPDGGMGRGPKSEFRASVVIDDALGDTDWIEVRWTGPDTAVVAYAPVYASSPSYSGGFTRGYHLFYLPRIPQAGDLVRTTSQYQPEMAKFYPAGSAPQSSPTGAASGIVPVGPQYKIGDQGPAGGTVVEIRPGPTPAPMPIQPTGQTTIVDMPGAGPTRLPVFYAPVPRPSIQPGPSGKPVVVLPVQPSNLPTMPTREAVRARLVQEEQEGLPPGMYDPDEFFPLYVPERLPIRATPAKGRAGRADTAAEADQVDVSIRQIRAGKTDLFDRPYPQAKPLRTLPTAPPSPSGLMPTVDVTPKVKQAIPETDGAVLVQVPSAKVPDAPGASGQAGIGILIAGTGGGFLIAGPIGAAVGAAAALLLGKGK